MSGCAGALAQEEVFIVGRGSPSLVGTVGTWCGALRAPSAGQAFARAGAHRCRPQPRAGTGPSATSESRTSSREEPAARLTQLLAATRSLTWCCACRSPPAPRCGNERSGCGLASTVRAMHTRAVLCPSLVPSPVAAGSRAVHAGGVLAAGPWPALIDVQHLCSSSEALRHAKLSPARQELLRRAEEERTADAEQVSVHKLD